MPKRKQTNPKRLVKKPKPTIKELEKQLEDTFNIRTGSGYCILETIGGRDYMEDRTSVSLASIKKGENTSLYAVYDGHGGDGCSEFCKKNLFKYLKKSEGYGADLPSALRDSFLQVEEKYKKRAEKENISDGSTATVVAIRDKRLVVANVGDSRAILIRQKGRALALTRDHDGKLKDERKRIEKEKGFVVFDEEGDVHRVGGILAVTRAIGDFYLPCVTAIPETKEIDLTEEDLFVLIASDGIWDVISHGEASKYLKEYGLKDGVKRITKLALKRGSEDNISLVAVQV
mmetsp:Transcript_431/g.542  ORF Transcript_431/g.542 Transcript_431/m.542 type:complete len:288 (+) Transcript_431:168-1031(+)